MKILIIGSNSILSKAILKQHPLDEIDILYHSKPPENLKNSYSISDLKNMKDEYSWVYIISAFISNSIEESDTLYEVNVKLVKEISMQFQKAKLIYFSTVAIYDNLNKKLINDKTPPSPNSLYGISKLWAEKIINQHKKFCILRISSMYGEGMKNSTFLPKIIDNAISKKQIILNGDGKRKQNYIHADDVAVLAKKIANLDENRIQLAISNKNYKNSEVAEIIKNELDCSILYEGKDTSRSIEYHQESYPFYEYNFTSFENGIKKLIEWKRKQF